MTAKPFLKWAGGKTQLIGAIQKSLPYNVVNKKFTYIEPFIGSGAILFWMLQSFPNLERAIINDINGDLINCYKIIASNPADLICELSRLQEEYHCFENDIENKSQYYYKQRELFNLRQKQDYEHAALFIFLNRTCFNGLYRVNSKNYFNVPMGSYKKPTICDTDNLMAVSKVLQRVEILQGDFEQSLEKAQNNTLFYFDPPYKPLSNTSSFNSYSVDNFGDEEQIRLKNFCLKLDRLGHSWILSNSDVKDKKSEDNFFDDLYSDFTIKRVDAKRIINANPEKRGALKELLVTNTIDFSKYVKAI